MLCEALKRAFLDSGGKDYPMLIYISEKILMGDSSAITILFNYNEINRFFFFCIIIKILEDILEHRAPQHLSAQSALCIGYICRTHCCNNLVSQTSFQS